MAVPAPAQPTPMQAVALGAKYGPNSALAFQRSQYLADALRSMQESGTDNLRSPANLGLHLLAQGITAYAKNKADKQAMTAYQGDLADQERRLLVGTPLDTSSPKTPPLVATDAPPQAQALAAALQAPTPAPDSAAPTQSASLSDADRMNLARMVYGEARGEPPLGQEAVAAVALNRMKRTGKPLADLLNAPHQFAGMNSTAAAATADQLAPILANIAPAIQGQDPTGGADHFYNPQLASPSWGQGPGQVIGHHKFMALDGPLPPQLQGMAANGPQGVSIPGANQPVPGGPQLSPQQQADAVMANHQLPPGTLMGGGNPGQPGQDPMQAAGFPPVQPYQVASNGPTPPPPQQPNPTAPPPSSPPAPQGPAPAPGFAPPGAGAPQVVPHQFVAPEEWQQAAALLHDPRTRDLGIQEILKLKMRAASPVDMKPGTFWGADGKPHSVEQFADQPGSPNAIVQRSNLDNHVTATANPAYGAVPGGMVMGASGGISQVPTEQRKTFRIPGAPGLYVTDEKGNPQKVADDNYTVKDVGGTMQELTGSQQYDKAAKLTEMYRGAVQAATRPGGISDAELKDNAAQIFSGGVARQFNAKMLDEGQGPWLRLKQIAPEIASGQKLSPQARQAMVQAMHDYATEAQTAFNGLAQSKSAYALQNGVDLSPFIKPLMQPLPPVPNFSSIPTGIGGYETGAPQSPANAQAAAIQAEIARRKAAGTWTGH